MIWYLIWGFFLACCKARKTTIELQKRRLKPDNDDFVLMTLSFIGVTLFWPLWITAEILTIIGKILFIVSTWTMK